MKMKTFKKVVKELKESIDNEPTEVESYEDNFDSFLRGRSNNKIHKKKKA